jgi:hypothetical protein
MHPNSKLKAEFSATASSDHQCVTELISNDNPLSSRTINAAIDRSRASSGKHRALL